MEHLVVVRVPFCRGQKLLRHWVPEAQRPPKGSNAAAGLGTVAGEPSLSTRLTTGWNSIALMGAYSPLRDPKALATLASHPAVLTSSENGTWVPATMLSSLARSTMVLLP